MRTLTFDGQSFLLGGRRIWLVSGGIDYARTPRELWESRILAAKQAGLNCVTTAAVWSQHEPRSGVFEFGGDLELDAFLALLAKHDMFCILRAGPYVGGDYDLGGIPAWLAATPDIRLRSGDPQFLEAASRYFRELLTPIVKRQVTQDARGPVALIQVEDQYFLHDTALAEGYLAVLARYVRECAIDVPIIGANNLWHSVEGQVDVWSGGDQHLSTMRQLRIVAPRHPVCRRTCGRVSRRRGVSPHRRRSTRIRSCIRWRRVLAGGGQFNLSPFHGGTNFEFRAGRLAEDQGEPAFATTSSHQDAPLREAGGRGDAYRVTKRLATFASTFGRVFTVLDPDDHAAVVDPASLTARAGKAADPAIVHVRGSQGSVVFLFGSPGATGKAKRAERTILLANGVHLPVTLPDQSVAWCLCDVNIAGRAVLDYTNLCAFTAIDRMLVLFGAAGSEGIVSINDSAVSFEVPKGKTPRVERHEGITLVIANTEQIDACCPHDGSLLVGVDGVTPEGEYIPHPKHKQCIVIDPTGEVSRQSMAGGRSRAGQSALKDWEAAPQTSLVDGSYARFAPIEGPASLTDLGAPTGYGYYRIEFNGGIPAHKALLFPHSGDRLAIYIEGKHHDMIGAGPGACGDRFTLPVRKKAGTIVILADNLGRFSARERLGEARGIVSPLYAVTPLKLTSPEVADVPALDPTQTLSPLFLHHEGEMTDDRRLRWTVSHRKKSPLLLSLEACAVACVVVVNDTPIGLHAACALSSPTRFLLDDEVLRRGNNLIELAPLEPIEGVASALKSAVTLEEITAEITDGATWSFAKWDCPDDESFGPFPRSHPKGATGVPTWMRTNFKVSASDAPVRFDPGSLTKGQLFLNGRNIGRYFTHTQAGAPVGPQESLYLPEPWLDVDGMNTLLVFDEHGGDPRQCRILLRQRDT
jgi:beta-galactosidase